MWKLIFLLPASLIFVAVNGHATANETPSASLSGETSPEDWDIETLKRHGLDPNALEKLDRLGKIPAGMNVVDISLNGDFIGSFQLQVTPQGAMCFTPELLEELGLSVPDAARSQKCYDWAASDSQISLAWQQETQSLSIVVPSSWLVSKRDEGEYGGSAIHVNYNYFSSVNRSRNHQERYSWLALDSGINLANWMLRSQQNFQQDKQGLTATVNSTYLERYVSKLNKTLQAGEINVKNTLFSLDTLNGFQLSPDDVLSQGEGGSGVNIEGIANTPQARVEVRQYDQIIYSTLVPAGPFNLENIPVQNLNTSLDVTVIENHGENQHFVVPVTQLTRFNGRSSPGFSLAIGSVKRVAQDGATPAILTLNQNWQPGPSWSLRSGALLSKTYHSLAISLNGVPKILASSSSLSLQAIVEQNDSPRSNGAKLQLSGSHNLSQDLSLSLGMSKNSPGFITLNEAKQRNSQHNDQQNNELSLSANWSPQWLGTLSLSYSRTRSYQNNQLWRYAMLSWNRRFTKNFRLSLSASQGSGGKQKNKNISLNVNWSLGETHFRHYYRAYNHREVVGSEVSAPLSDYSDYNLALEQINSDHSRSIQASLNSDLRYTRLSLNTQQDTQHNSNYSVSGQGAVILYPYGVGFSNNPVSDTFGLLSLNRPVAGIPIITPGGTAWTDWRGEAVLPSIPPWQDSSLNIDVDKLPKNIDVINGHRTLHLARGTVKKVQIALLSGTRLLLTIRLADGQMLPKGSTLWQEGGIVAEAVDEGVVFLSNAADQASMRVKIARSKEECNINYQVDDEDDDDRTLYKRLDVTCQ
ncbi:fimbria/pilus outer membrane usher protein [Pantoea agglomerans]|uniref:Fimbria/pilus outer membrane usher protein n=1 Tax=Enterobacter agglomerans TaxID=549 RepID=A0ACC5RKM4_ENTAG|nr:fimbria/pilus outer membrane usher protein [Pantoea agglomerans]MBK4725197.1 fimbria/pilus outer membrane usher protein [Pantoea agglomerans]